MTAAYLSVLQVVSGWLLVSTAVFFPIAAAGSLAFTSCPSDVDLGCSPAAIPDASADEVQATTDCGTPVITVEQGIPLESGSGCGYTRTDVWTATDGCQNTQTCSRTYTWTIDTEPPLFTSCPPDESLGSNPLDLPDAWPEEATAIDDCGTPVVTVESGQRVQNGCMFSRTDVWTATDACGNTAQCSRTYTWETDIGLQIELDIEISIRQDHAQIDDAGPSPVVQPWCVSMRSINRQNIIDATLTAPPGSTLPDGILRYGQCLRFDTLHALSAAMPLGTYQLELLLASDGSTDDGYAVSDVFDIDRSFPFADAPPTVNLPTWSNGVFLVHSSTDQSWLNTPGTSPLLDTTYWRQLCFTSDGSFHAGQMGPTLPQGSFDWLTESTSFHAELSAVDVLHTWTDLDCVAIAVVYESRTSFPIMVRPHPRLGIRRAGDGMQCTAYGLIPGAPYSLYHGQYPGNPWVLVHSFLAPGDTCVLPSFGGSGSTGVFRILVRDWL